MKSAIRDAAFETDVSRGLHGVTAHPIHRQTTKKIIRQIGGTLVRGQTTTHARAREALDVRNFISIAAMNAAFAVGLSHQLIANMDSTTFVVKFTDSYRVIKISTLIPTTKTQRCALDLLVKQFFLVTASGHMAPPLYMLIDDSVPEDEFENLKSVDFLHLFCLEIL